MTNVTSELNLNSVLNLTNYSSNSFYHGVDWIYSYTETFFMYNFNVSYNLFTNNLYQDNFDFNFYTLWFSSLDVSYYTLFWSVLVDNLINLNLLKLPFLDFWYKSVFSSSDFSVFLFSFPEYIFISNSFVMNFIQPFSSELNSALFVLNSQENILTPVMLVPHLIVLFIFVLFFIVLFFSYYSSSTREETTIDHDFLIANTTVEAEEEIGSFDDMFLAVLILVFVFLWYFYVNTLTVFTVFPEFILAMYLFPALYYLILLIPVFLAYDFGIYFVAYLRGVGASPVSFVEIGYDYIAFAAFYIRLLVQNVRIILMLFTFASFHEIVTMNFLDKEWIFGDENFLDDVLKTSFTPSGFTYFLFFKLSGHIIYFFYELFHLFFVITAQIIAFHAMVFWLFLFLYTMFSSELHEKFFGFKRSVKKGFYSRYVNLKKNILKKN